MKVSLQAAAPPKPALGAPCNGCGICCSMAPCPLSHLLLGHRTGTCPALRWEGGRYWCGLVIAPRGIARWLPRGFVLRWIAVGSGCDCGAVIDDEIDVA